MDSRQTTDLNDEQFRANRFELVSRLADDIAHEIKNPLNAIVINLEVLKVRIGKGSPDAALERVSVIEHEARRLHGLVDRLLQLLRPEREEVTSFALDQVIDELLPLVEARARLARNELRRDCNATVFVPARRDVLKFALLNVLTAVHERLGEGGGTLTLDCELVEGFIRIRVGASMERGPLGDGGALFESALVAAEGQVLSCGGRLERLPDAVDVLLPRAGPL